MSNTQVQVSKFQELLHRCKVDFKKAISLAKSMFKAGQTNAELKDTLSELGLAYYYQHKNAKNHLESQEIKNLISKVDYLDKLMELHEGEIQKVKLASK